MLRPSLTVAMLAVSEELEPCIASGERVVDVMTSEADGGVFVATDSEHEFGVKVYGYTDEPELPGRAR
jgi:hypothetical protein